jgi:hypothetical protein
MPLSTANVRNGKQPHSRHRVVRGHRFTLHGCRRVLILSGITRSEYRNPAVDDQRYTLWQRNRIKQKGRCTNCRGRELTRPPAPTGRQRIPANRPYVLWSTRRFDPNGEGPVNGSTAAEQDVESAAETRLIKTPGKEAPACFVDPASEGRQRLR